MKSTEMPSETIFDANSLTAATREEQQQRRDVERAFNSKRADGKARMSEILYAKICSTVRNALVRDSIVSPDRSRNAT